MKPFFTILFATLSFYFAKSQCSDLFISEYVEGWSNNKALEIYNPTANTIDLSYYSISRYTNGEVTASTPQQLEGMMEPYSTFVIGLDKRDPEGTGYDAPMWDGYYTYTDSITGEDVTTYDSESDLQGLIDFWANGEYYGGTDPDSAAMYPMTMFFNGNDAITLERIGLGVVDLIGRVGEDPGAGWTDSNGAIWTKDHTMVRKPSVTSGVISNPLIFDPTLEWDSLPANTFTSLGFHYCECDPADLIEKETGFSLYPNPVTSNQINIVSEFTIQNIQIHNNHGQLILEKVINNLNSVAIERPKKRGFHYISIHTTDGVKVKSILL